MTAVNRCVYCGQPASAYSIISDGTERKIFLCPSCYRKLFATQEQRRGGERACPSCGTTLADFRRTGLLGCADCYSTFRDELLATLRSVQGNLRHEGKSPAAPLISHERVFYRVQLKEQLEQAMRDENYRYAEELREQLSRLTKQSKGT